MNKKITTQIIAAILFVLILITTLITLVSSLKAKNLAFFNYSFFIMQAETQPKIASKGDLVIAKKMKNGEVKVGDNIVYGSENVYYCDEIIETKNVNTVSKIIIAEKEGIKYQFSENDISGKVIKTIPQIGNTIIVLRSVFGIIACIAFILFIHILLRLTMLKNKEKEENK